MLHSFTLSFGSKSDPNIVRTLDYRTDYQTLSQNESLKIKEENFAFDGSTYQNRKDFAGMMHFIEMNKCKNKTTKQLFSFTH